MEVTAKLDGQEKPVRTLADLENGVAAKVQVPTSNCTFVRWRDEELVLGPNADGVIERVRGRLPRDYEVLEVLGKLTIHFEDE